MHRHDRKSERNLLPEQRQPAARYSREERPSDAELLSRHVAGDRDAFGELYRRHRDQLRAVAARTLGDPEEAADALQDAMIAAFRRADGFRGDSAVTTWLHRIVVNSALDRMRRRAARPAAACQDENALDALANAGRPAADPSASSDTAIDVRTALQRLDPEQQAALVLVDMLGYPVARRRLGARRLGGNSEKPRSPRPGATGATARAPAARSGAQARPETIRRRARPRQGTTVLHDDRLISRGAAVQARMFQVVTIPARHQLDQRFSRRDTVVLSDR